VIIAVCKDGAVRFGLLGPLTVEAAGASVPVASGRQRTLLAALLLQPGQVVSADTLIRHVWGEDPPANARAALQVHILRLRRALDGHGPERIVTRPPGYLLALAPGDEVDLAEFDATLAAADEAASTRDTAAEAAHLGRALALWRGPALEGVEAGSLRREVAERLAERRLAAIERRVEAELSLGRHADLVPELRSLTAGHPLRERLWAQLMLALAASGQQAGALSTYDAVRKRLVADLGVEPGAELRAAHQRVLRPERDPAPVAVPAQLPTGTPVFTGRGAYLDRLDAARRAAASAVGVCAIVGTAGVGKTALSVHWGHLASRHFPDGQLYLNMRGFATTPPVPPAEALAAFLRALGVPPERVPSDVDEAASLYRSVLDGKRVLVVLDNVAGADQVRPLIPGSAGSFVLVTSRNRLSGLVTRDGADRLALDTLPPAEARALLARTLGAARVDADPAAAAALAEACAHLPLALRIVAAKLADEPRHGIADLAGALHGPDGLAALELNGDSAVRSAFELSEAALAPAAARLFALLGLAPTADFTAATAGAVAGLTPAEGGRLLRALAAAHLLDEVGPGRFACHDLLRRYAVGRAEERYGAAEGASSVRRLVDWYVHATDAAAEAVYPHRIRLRPSDSADAPAFDDVAAAARWLDDEAANLVLVVQHAAGGAHRPAAWLLADMLRGYYALSGHRLDWLTTGEAGLRAAIAEGDLRGQAAMRMDLGNALMRDGSAEPARAHFSELLDLARRIQWADGEGAALGLLGNVYRQFGRTDQAEQYLRGAAELFEKLGQLPLLAGSLGNLGLALRELGRLPEALDCHHRALALYRQIGSRYGEAMGLGNLGETYHDLGDGDAALDHLVRALDLHREVSDRTGEAESRRILATVHRDAGRHDEALADGRYALAFARETGSPQAETVALETVASIHLAAGDTRTAADLYEQALAMAEDTGERYPAVQARIGLARARHALGDTASAHALAAEAARLATDYHYPVLATQARALVTRRSAGPDGRR
jgi:DNA-binding SARP family transcriptional activator